MRVKKPSKFIYITEEQANELLEEVEHLEHKDYLIHLIKGYRKILSRLEKGKLRMKHVREFFGSLFTSSDDEP